MELRRALVLAILVFTSISLTLASDYNYDDDDQTDNDYEDEDYNGNCSMRANVSMRNSLSQWAAKCGRAALNPESARSRRAATQRIVNGHQSANGHWPSFARIGLVRAMNKDICNGVLITDRHVLTAAHCLDSVRKADEIYASLGHYDNSKSDTNEQFFQIKKICKASGYGKVKNAKGQMTGLKHDWAVLTLNKPITVNNYVEPACMPPSEKITKSLCYVVGTGFTMWHEGHIQVAPHKPHQLPMSAVKCEPRWPNIPSNDPSRSCWSSKGGIKGQVCIGDSGGPILCLDTSRNPKRWRVAAITSYIDASVHCDGSSSTSRVTVFTKIPTLVNDIKRQCGL